AALDVKVVQLVRLLRAGEQVRMSKRSGDFVTLREVVDEVGSDAVRFMMLFRKNDAVLDFDLAKVLEQSKDNPVFYVQYGHARGHSIFKNAREVIPDLPEDDAARAAYLAGAARHGLFDMAGWRCPVGDASSRWLIDIRTDLFPPPTKLAARVIRLRSSQG